MKLVPDDFAVSLGWETAQYRVRPLVVGDCAKDFDAVDSSRAALRGAFGPKDPWPAPELDLAKNLRDLEGHATEFRERVGFTYTLETAEGTRCLGCLYVLRSERPSYDAKVIWWVRQSEIGSPFAAQLERDVRAWLASAWPFRKVWWPGRDHAWE